MKRILVGTNGSEGGTAAVAWAAELCRAVGGEVVVATAWSPTEDPGPLETELERRDERRRALEETWSAAARAAGVTTEARLLEGEVATELERAAGEEDADLVVIGAHHDGASPDHSHLAHHLVHHLGRPLAVAPDPVAMAGSTIVVGVDGSRASNAPLRWAIDVAHDVGAQIAAVFAHDPLADSYPHADRMDFHYRGEEAVLTQLDQLSERGATVELVHRAGDTVEVLERAADDLGASAIVVGTRGRGSLHGLLVGRVPIRLVNRATRPVVVVPH